MGLTQQQLVAVLTTEASIDINRRQARMINDECRPGYIIISGVDSSAASSFSIPPNLVIKTNNNSLTQGKKCPYYLGLGLCLQAEQLWRTLVPEEDKNADVKQVGNSSKITSRSHSPPPTSSSLSGGAAGGTLPSTVQETHGRLEVGSFLRLADLLHEKVVDDSVQEFDDTQGGSDAVNGDCGAQGQGQGQGRVRDSGDEMECGRGVLMGSNSNACNIRERLRRLRRFASEAVYRPWFSRTSQVFLFGSFGGDGSSSDNVALISFLLFSFFFRFTGLLFFLNQLI